MKECDQIEALYRELGERIKAARKESKMSQADLARTVGMTRVSVTNIEAGKQRPALYICYYLAASLGLDLWDLLPAKMPDDSPSSMEDEPAGGTESAMLELSFRRLMAGELESVDLEDPHPAQKELPYGENSKKADTDQGA